MHKVSLTIKSSGGLARQLVMPIVIMVPGDPTKQVQVVALWDTGATGTVITQKVVDAIGLKPISKTKVNTASEEGVPTDVYLVDVALNQNVKIDGVPVTRGKLTGIDCLIGMDIITLGDFSITNFNGVTCMSFGLPSSHEVDYVKVSRDKKAVTQSNADYMKNLKRKKK